MNHRIWAIHAALAVLTSTSIAADNAPVEAQVNGVEIGKQSAQSDEAAEVPSQARCMNQCNAAETRCGSEVRRARAQCSKKAASGGRNPFTGRNDDYAYWCSHFRNPSISCAPGIHNRACQARYDQRYELCVNAMYDNIADLRYDCFRSERAAQNFCREELRDCKAACP